MTGEPVLWWVTRSSGLMTLLLLTVTVVLGGTACWGDPAGRAMRQEVHRWAAGLAVGLLVVHVGTAVVDPYVGIGTRDAVVPFLAGYRTVWLGVGTLAADLLLAVLGTSLLRTRLPAGGWRSVHLLAYGAWPLAAAHAIGAGTDVDRAAFRGVAAGCVTAVVLVALARLARGRAPAGTR